MVQFKTVLIAALMMTALRAHSSDVSNESETSTKQEIEHLEAEKTRLQADIKKFDGEAAANEKVISDNRAKIEKAKAEVETLQQLKSEKAGHFLTLASQREKVLEEMKQMEQEKVQAEKDLQIAKEQEKKAQQEFEQLKAEHAKSKARLEAYLGGLKNRYREMQERKKSMQDEQARIERQTASLETQARVGESELQGDALKLKKSCRVFDSPGKGSKVLTVQQGGTSISKSEEGKTWIAFPLADGRKGYIAKTCF